jgi:DNA repair protein RadD
LIVARDYQIAAHSSVLDWWKKSIEPCVVEAATGSGKSVIVAMLAKSLYDLSKGKRVLCLAPSKELTEQNVEKYKALGEQCSVYSASISKSLRHPVVYATEGTFKSVAKRLAHEFAGVIIDEAHRLTPTIKKIIEELREGNPNLRVCGLSATPYRLDGGFIFAKDTDGNPISELQAKDPYFAQLVYTIGAKELIARGYLTPPKVGDINSETYDTSGLELAKNGQYTQSSLDRAFAGWGRKTANIVADVVAQARGHTGVMIFCSTNKHAEEVMASLPPEMSALVTGGTPKGERASIIARFKAQKIKYLVNVSVLTTGFDAPHVSLVAILRATESVSLLQQIIGRGLRLFEGKPYALILDYAGNIEKHCPDGDLFRPEIRAPYQGKGEAFIECVCPECNATNHFAARKNDAGLEVNHMGYFVDLDGNEIIDAVTGKPLPAHHGRRCRNLLPVKGGTLEPCSYYWSCKICPVCEADNDIAARYCRSCKEELIDPAKKLVEIHTKAKKDPSIVQCDEVLNMDVVDTLSRAGKPMLRVTFTTAYRVFTVYFLKQSDNQWQHDQYQRFIDVGTPRTVRYVKKDDFWQIKGYNQKTDDEILQERLAA